MREFWLAISARFRRSATRPRASFALYHHLVHALCRRRFPARSWRWSLGTSLVVIFKLPVETIGSRFGGIPSGFPHFAVPPHSIRSASASDLPRHHRGDVRSDRIANVCGRFGSDERRPGTIPTSNSSPRAWPISFHRSLAACPPPARSRAPRPISAPARKRRSAGMIHALTLLAILLFAAPLARFIPLAVLAGDPFRRLLQHGRVAGNS